MALHLHLINMKSPFLIAAVCLSAASSIFAQITLSDAGMKAEKTSAAEVMDDAVEAMEDADEAKVAAAISLAQYYPVPFLDNEEVNFGVFLSQEYAFSSSELLEKTAFSNVQLEVYAKYPGNRDNWFKYMTAGVSGSLLSLTPLDLDPTDIGFVEPADLAPDEGITSFQQYSIPSITELIRFARYNFYVGTNVLHFSSGNDNAHLLVDAGVHYISTPIGLGAATGFVDESIGLINDRIRALQVVIDSIQSSEGGVFSDPVDNEKEKEILQEEIESLTALSDAVGTIAEEKVVDGLNSVSETRSEFQFYFTPSLKYGISSKNGFNLQVSGEVYFPLNKINLSPSLFTTQPTELTKDIFDANRERLDSLGLQTVGTEILADRHAENFAKTFYVFGLQLSAKVKSNVRFYVSTQFLYAPREEKKDKNIFDLAAPAHLMTVNTGFTYYLVY